MTNEFAFDLYNTLFLNIHNYIHYQHILSHIYKYLMIYKQKQHFLTFWPLRTDKIFVS